MQCRGRERTRAGQIKILEALEQHKDGLTSEELARLCGVSSKTVRTDAKAIMTELPAEIAMLSSSKRQGYWLSIKDNSEFARLLTRNQATDGDERCRVILDTLLHTAITGQPVRQQDVADRLTALVNEILELRWSGNSVIISTVSFQGLPRNLGLTPVESVIMKSFSSPESL